MGLGSVVRPRRSYYRSYWGNNNDLLLFDDEFGMAASGAVGQLDGDGGRNGVAPVAGDGHESGPAVTDLDAKATVRNILDKL